MGQRPYLQELTRLSGPLRAAIAFGLLAALSWLILVTLSWGFEIEVDALSSVLFGSMGAVIVCVGIELNRHEKTWIRVIGVLLIVAVVIAVVLVALLLWYISLLCENGCG
jgi:hypothetical protein